MPPDNTDPTNNQLRAEEVTPVPAATTNTPKKSGNKAVLIICVLVILAILTFIGWKIFNKPNDEINSDTGLNTTSNTVPEPTGSPPTEAKNYLEIKQFNIEIPTDDLTNKDVEYTINKVSDTNYSHALIKSKSLTKELDKEFPGHETHEDFGAAALVLIPTKDFVNGTIDYPNDAGRLQEADAVATVGENKVFVSAATFIDVGKDYIKFVDSVKTAAKDAVEL